MRQTHVGGEKLFVDYAGDTVPVIIDRLLRGRTLPRQPVTNGLTWRAEKHCGLAERTAQAYMRLARNRDAATIAGPRRRQACALENVRTNRRALHREKGRKIVRHWRGWAKRRPRIRYLDTP